MKTLVKWFRRCTEFVAAMMMAAMFLTFILQNRHPLFGEARMAGETFPVRPSQYAGPCEFCLALWVWIVFWGAAFVVR